MYQSNQHINPLQNDTWDGIIYNIFIFHMTNSDFLTYLLFRIFILFRISLVTVRVISLF